MDKIKSIYCDVFEPEKYASPCACCLEWKQRQCASQKVKIESLIYEAEQNIIKRVRKIRDGIDKYYERHFGKDVEVKSIATQVRDKLTGLLEREEK